MCNNYTQEFATSHNVYYICNIPYSASEATSQNGEYLSVFLAWIGNQVGVTYGDDGYFDVSSLSWSPKETPYNIDIGMIYGFTKQ